MPTYPLQARRHEIEGTVVLRVHVGADGNAQEIRVQSSSGSSLLDAAAVDAVKRSAFRPAHAASGSAVDSWVAIPYRFVLQ